MTDQTSYFDDAHSAMRRKADVFRPKGGQLTYEVDADYQLAKIILIKANGERQTVCVLDWESAYEFGTALSVSTVGAVCRQKEADSIERLEIEPADGGEA